MSLKKLIGTRAFYRNLLAIAIPIIIQNAISNFISLLDNVMVGLVGTEQMSGVAIVNQLLMVFYLCVFGAVSGAGLFGAQFFGKGDHEGVRATFRFKLYVTLFLYAAAMVALTFFGEPLISLYLHEGSETGDLALTLQYAKEYLAIALIGLLPYTLTQVYSGSLREINRTLPPMYAGIIGVAVNLILNYLLIFGKLGFPEMGVRGAALATVISRFVECLIVILWAHLNPGKCQFIKGVYRSFRIPAPLMKQILVTGMPLILNETLWSAGQAMLLQCYSYRGIATVSAMNIAGTISNTFSVLYLSIGTAISIQLGHLLGAEKPEEAKDSSVKLLAFAVLMGILSGGLIALCAPFFPKIYNTTDEVRNLAVQLTLVIASAAPLQAIINASYFTLRSGGKTVLTFVFDSAYVWCVSVPLAFCLAHFSPLPILPVYMICNYFDVCKCTAGILLVKKGIWVRDITVPHPEPAG